MASSLNYYISFSRLKLQSPSLFVVFVVFSLHFTAGILFSSSSTHHYFILVLPSLAYRTSTDISSSFEDKMTTNSNTSSQCNRTTANHSNPVYGQQQPSPRRASILMAATGAMGSSTADHASFASGLLLCMLPGWSDTGTQQGRAQPRFFEFNSDVSQSYNPLSQSVADSETPVLDLVRGSMLGRLAMDSTDDQPR